MKNIQKELLAWLDKRPLWWRLPLKKLLRSEGISRENILEFADYALKEVQGQWDQIIDIDFREIISMEEQPSISLESISDMQNVNAIASGRSLNFGGEGVTVVYGDNGSGKSGYVRAIKAAGGVSGADPIRGNIYLTVRPKHNQPKCHVKLSNSETPIICDLSCHDPPALRNITAFDASIAMDYIGTSREASFEPRVFGVLSELAKVVDKVNKFLTERVASIDLHNPTIPTELNQAPVFNCLRQLDHNSQLEAELFDWDVSDDNKLNEYQRNINEKDPNNRIKRLQGQMEALDSINTYLNNLSSYFEENCLTLTSLLDTWNNKHRQYQLLSKDLAELAEDHDKEDLDNDVWRNLWKYANDYVRQVKLEVEKQKTCPLCRQPMEGDVLDRFNRMNDYVNSQLTFEMTETEQDFQAAARPNFQLQDKQIVTSLFAISDVWEDGPPYCELIIGATEKVAFLKKAIPKSIHATDIKFGQLDNLLGLKRLVKEKKISIQALIDQLKWMQDEKEIIKLSEELLNLKARKFCNENRSMYEDLIQRHRQAFDLAKAEKTAKTNSITIMTNSLSDRLLSQEYENNFNEELQALTDGSIKVKLRNARPGKGRVPFKIQIEDVSGRDHPPNAILSEGEQRIVSLAAFIADNSMGNIRGPLIFDDPISSLDFDYEGRTVERLVKLAKNRQVIVFTHRLSLLCAFSEICLREGVVFKDAMLISVGREKGIPTAGYLKKKKLKPSLNAMIHEDIPCLKKIDVASPEYARCLESLCSRFRTIVENCIEGILLCNITSRFQREIRSNRVNRLKELKADDCEMVDRMMTKYSCPLHSHSIETPFVMPDLEKIEDDITQFRDWAIEAKRRLAD